jgi:type VI secretion system protein VasJ
MSWHWNACGKHPAAKDYFSIGRDHLLFRVMADWVKNGYEMLGATSKGYASENSRAYRFWGRGWKRHTVSVGILKDSCDLIGRPYPLLLVGAGVLERWEAHWDLLPFAFESTWGYLEYIAAKRLQDLDQLNSELVFCKAPEPDWPRFMNERHLSAEKEEYRENEQPLDIHNIEKGMLSLEKNAEVVWPLDRDGVSVGASVVKAWHYFLKTRFGAIPHTVFLGGFPNRDHIAVFSRALNPADFIRLWSPDHPGAT